MKNDYINDYDCIKEYARKKIEHIELIQKDLDELRICDPKDELLNLLARRHTKSSLGTAINLLQELKSFYEKLYKNWSPNDDRIW